MQDGGVYTDFNAASAKYRELSKILDENKQLLTWSTGERVLDAGCGPGDVTSKVIAPFLPQDYSVLVGVDISPKMTAHGLLHHADPKITFHTLNIGEDISEFLQDPRYSEGFNKIFSFYVMNWVKDLEKGVVNLYRLLKPGGQALLMFPVNRHFQKTYQRISSDIRWAEYFKDVQRKISPYLTSEDPGREFENMLSAAGFEIIKCQTKHQHDEFDSISILKGLIESLDQHISCVPADIKPQYLDDCVRIMDDMQAIRVENDKVLLNVTKIVAVIKKQL